MTYQDITHIADTCILVPWIDNPYDKQYKPYGYHTGVDLKCTNVYSGVSGVVIQTGIDSSGMYELTIQYDAITSLRYMHLKHVSTHTGAILQAGDHIGVADKYVHFEYISTQQETSKWPVRVGAVTYFKHNPELLLTQNSILNSNDWSSIHVINTYYKTPYDLNNAMTAEFESDNRGDR